MAFAELRVHALDICVKLRRNAALLLTRGQLRLCRCRLARPRIGAIEDRRLGGIAGACGRLLSAWRRLDLANSAETHAVAEAAGHVRRPLLKLVSGPVQRRAQAFAGDVAPLS